MPLAFLLRLPGDWLMLLASLGAALLTVALLLSGTSAALGFLAGWREDPMLGRVGRNVFYLAAAGVVAASATLLVALLVHDFAIAFVTEHTDRSLPVPLLAAAFYGGQEGSLLYWTLLLTALGSVAVATAAGVASTGARLTAYANGFLATIATFFLALLVFVASPFSVLPIVPADGLGLNPVLRDGGMLIHPPFLLAGFSSFAVPFAFAMASLLANRQDSAWIAQTRRFALVSWGLQSVGLTLGMWWAYHVLGWGGYWGWDAVENVALMPWLATTAYLHSIQVQERRGQLRAWNQSLVVAAFLLSVFGTFIVRSGILPSVHTFALSPLGPWFLGFLVACILVSGLVLSRRAGTLRSDRPLEVAVSREGAFLLQNVLLVTLTAAILWGTVLPLLSGMLGHQVVVGPPYYERVAAPLVVGLLALFALGALLPWGRAGRTWRRGLRWPLAAAGVTAIGLLAFGVRGGALLALPLIAGGLGTCLAEYVRGWSVARRAPSPWPVAAARLTARSRRRYGAFLAHAGVLVVAAGFAGSHFLQQQQQATLHPGQTLTVGGHPLTFQGTANRQAGDHSELVARLRLGDETLEPARLSYPSLGGQAVTRVAIRSSALDDVYVVLVGTATDGTATLNVFVNPLVTWIWAGAALLITGVLLGNLGRTQAEMSAAVLPAPVPVGAP